MKTSDVKIGDTVRAFHPGMFGVIREGNVVKRGSKYAHIDFGELRGGIFKVPYKDITEVTGRFM